MYGKKTIISMGRNTLPHQRIYGSIYLCFIFQDIYQTGGQLSEANLLALTYISYIGCGVSLLGLIFTLLTYFMFRYIYMF
jgi:hypothetical protein